MDKKTTILLDTAGFLAAVHNYKKSEIADLIVALCEFNLYGCTSVKLTDMKKIHFDAIQEVIELRNSRWLKTCEINAQNAKKRTANRKATAERNSSEPPEPAQSDRPEDKERDKENDSELDKEKESESDFINKKDKDKERENVDKSRYVGAPSVEEVAIYCKESGYTIDPVAFVKWNSDRGWMNGEKYIALDWRKAVRKWFCKENGLSYSEMESMTDICHDMLSKVKGAQDEASHT